MIEGGREGSAEEGWRKVRRFIKQPPPPPNPPATNILIPPSPQSESRLARKHPRNKSQNFTDFSKQYKRPDVGDC